jgi:ketosteroid isomerase-like protein
MFQAGSTVEDIDKAFELFTDDFTYVHAKFDGYYTRESLYKSALRNQKNGSYNGSVTGFKINNKIIGLKAAAVQKRFVEKRNGKTIESEPQLSLFEFKNGKISRIVEYW